MLKNNAFNNFNNNLSCNTEEDFFLSLKIKKGVKHEIPEFRVGVFQN